MNQSYKCPMLNAISFATLHTIHALTLICLIRKYMQGCATPRLVVARRRPPPAVRPRSLSTQGVSKAAHPPSVGRPEGQGQAAQGQDAACPRSGCAAHNAAAAAAHAHHCRKRAPIIPRSRDGTQEQGRDAAAAYSDVRVHGVRQK